MKWIKYSEAMPPIDQQVLLWVGECFSVATLKSFKVRDRIELAFVIPCPCNEHLLMSSKITHWMPLPGAPETESE